MSTMNNYVVLGITEDADSDTIRSAFRALARRYHPDAGAGSSAVEFQRALEAYETLSDPERRRVHDQHLRGSRVRPFMIPEPIVSVPIAEPLFGARAVSCDFSTRPGTAIRSTFFDELLDELLALTRDDWYWYRRWR